MENHLLEIVPTVHLHKSKFRSRFSAIGREEKVDEIFTKLTITISEFKKNPNEVVKKAKHKPFAVLTNNKASFYVMSPEYYDALLEKIWELEITPEIKRRLASKEKSRIVTLEELRNM
jgi:antitoxin StbD